VGRLSAKLCLATKPSLSLTIVSRGALRGGCRANAHGHHGSDDFAVQTAGLDFCGQPGSQRVSEPGVFVWSPAALR